MTVKPSLNRFEFDASLVLREADQAPVTADTRSSAIALDKLSAYWNDSDERAVPHQFAVIVETESRDVADTNETYVAEISVGNDAAGADVVLESRSVANVGRHVFVVTREALKAAQADATHLTVNMNVGGTTPSIAWNAYVAPLAGH